MANKIKYERVQVPFSNEQELVPTLLIDINGDESQFAVAEGNVLGTTHTDGYTVTDVAATLVEENLSRKSLLIINNDETNPIYIKAGGGVTADFHSVKVAGGKSYTTDSTGDSYEAIAGTGLTVLVTVEEIATAWPA